MVEVPIPQLFSCLRCKSRIIVRLKSGVEVKGRLVAFDENMNFVVELRNTPHRINDDLLIKHMIDSDRPNCEPCDHWCSLKELF